MMSMDLTKIELAKALKGIQAISNDEQFKKVKDIFIQNGDEELVMSAINGLNEEDEFALLTKLMGTTTHIIGFEQRPLIEGDYIVPDYYLSFKPGCSVHGKSSKKFTEFKCVLDVKSTGKDLFKIGGKNLRKLRNFSDLMGLRLFFAVRFLQFNKNALWAIVEDSDKTSTYIHVGYENVVKGLRHVFWDEYCLTPNPNLTVICKFSKSSIIRSVHHSDFGIQTEVSFSDGINELYKIVGEEAFFPSILLEATNLKEIKIQKIDNDITLQYLKPQNLTIFLADLIYQMNRLPIDEFGRIIYDAAKLIVRCDTDAHDRLINREKIELIAKPLIDNKVLFVGAIKDLDEHLELWKSFGGQE